MRLIPLSLAAALLVFLTACAPTPMIGHATVVNAPSGDTPQRQPETPSHSYASLPSVVTFDSPEALSAVDSIAFTTGFDRPGVESITGVGNRGEDILEFRDEGCVLTLRAFPASRSDLTFSDDDPTNTMLVVGRYLGNALPDSALQLRLRINGDQSYLDALAVTAVDEEGRRVLVIARGLGELDQFFYSEFVCDVGVSTETLFAEIVAPYMSVEMYG